MDGPENNYGYKLLPGWDPKAPDILAPGTRVKIRHFFGHKGKVVEWRGPLGVGGAQVYGVKYGPKGRRGYIEVRRDQLIVLPPKAASGEPAAAPTTPAPSPDPRPG